MDEPDELEAHQALPISDIAAEDIDLSRLPASGEEYLLRVRKEASTCPGVVVAKLDARQFDSRRTVEVSPIESLQPALRGFTPSLQWQLQQASDFADVRQAFRRRKAQQKLPACRHKFPSKDDELGWRRFCFGDTLKTLQTSAESSASEAPSDEGLHGIDPCARQGVNSQPLHSGRRPLLGVVGHLRQAVVIQLLAHQTKWLETFVFSDQQGQWLYALLCCLEKPIEADTTAVLRLLARYCARQRDELCCGEEDKRLAALNLLITLVIRYFGQLDLAEEFENG